MPVFTLKALPLMKTALRFLAAALFIGMVIWWIQAGRNPGWTKNQVAVEKKDEITEIVYTEYEDRFVPGIDLLAGAGAAALVLGGLSGLGRRKPVESATSRP